MAIPWDTSQRAFIDATAWFVQTTALVRGRWSEPGLGEWDVRALIGHTSRALLTVETYLDRPAETVDVATAAEYFQATRSLADGPDVAARGRKAGTSLGADPQGALEEISARVLKLIDARNGTELVTTIAGGMRLRDYLPTRTFELAVHTSDLCLALGAPIDIPDTAAMQALTVVSDLAVAGGLAGPLLLAATGRTALPTAFTVL